MLTKHCTTIPQTMEPATSREVFLCWRYLSTRRSVRRERVRSNSKTFTYGLDNLASFFSRPFLDSGTEVLGLADGASTVLLLVASPSDDPWTWPYCLCSKMPVTGWLLLSDSWRSIFLRSHIPRTNMTSEDPKRVLSALGSECRLL